MQVDDISGTDPAAFDGMSQILAFASPDARQTGSASNECWRQAQIREICNAYSASSYRQSDDVTVAAELLAEAGADDDMITVAVLRSVRFDHEVNLERLEKRLGAAVRQLFAGVQELDGISLSIGHRDVHRSSVIDRSDLSKVLVAVVDDPRVVVIHLAEMVVRLRNASQLSPPDRLRFARQILMIHTPLANKLGIWRMKWELEDLSFKYLQRPDYDRIARQLDERRSERENYIEDFVAALQTLMHRSRIKASVSGRAKHIYGIWRKLNRKGLEFDRIFDIRAVRILVKDIGSCYAALGAVHASWSAVAGEYDDYIAAPKANGYQSLHTAVYGSDDKIVEVQIRTEAMHRDCEFGVAAHWKYKDPSKSSVQQDRKVELLRQLIDWRSEISAELNASAEQDSAAEIYVLSPAGKVVELPAGATPIDFAYAIHTEVGHRCRGALVNGKMAPLTGVLHSADWVEIKTANRGGPSRDWLSAHAGFTVSARAKACIRRWFRHEEHGRYQAQGKVLLDKEILRRNLGKISLDKLAVDNGFRRSSDLLAAVGMGELKPAHALADLIAAETASAAYPEPQLRIDRVSAGASQTLTVMGVDNLLVSYASCCRPLPGDDVVGYVTVARGITVHRRNCGNIMRMAENNPDRLISVNLNEAGETSYSVDIELVARHSPQLLKDVVAAVAELGFTLSAVHAPPAAIGALQKIQLAVEISSTAGLRSVMSKLRRVEQVETVRRIGG